MSDETADKARGVGGTTLSAPAQADSTIEQEQDEAFDSRDGLRIAGQFLLREVVRYGGQAALVLALLAVIAGAGYWSLGEMRSLPQFINQIARPFLPPPTAKAPSPSAESKALAEKAEKARVEKARLAALPKKHHRHAAKNSVPKYVERRPAYAPYSSDPSGGRIIYQDSMITEYRWNK
ncbi:MAG: hypothetical protein KGS72_10745 [Cyanobacteria bacterium REEB67]|nr:hypothetical protein [Cyanobacteria bacterium REEB67]